MQINSNAVIKRLYTDRVETDGGGGYETIKQLVGQALAKKVALFLGYGWPDLLVEGAHEDLDPQARNCLDIVEEIHENFSKPRLVVNVYPRPDTQPESQEGRRRGAFAIQLDFGPRMLLVNQSMLDGMVALLDRSGEEVWNDGYLTDPLRLNTAPQPGQEPKPEGGRAAGRAGAGPMRSRGTGQMALEGRKEEKKRTKTSQWTTAVFQSGWSSSFRRWARRGVTGLSSGQEKAKPKGNH